MCGSLSYDIAVEIVEAGSRPVNECYAHNLTDHLLASERS